MMLTRQLGSQFAAAFAPACKDGQQKRLQCFGDPILPPHLKLQISLSVSSTSSEAHPRQELCPAPGLASAASGMAGGCPPEHARTHVLKYI